MLNTYEVDIKVTQQTEIVHTYFIRTNNHYADENEFTRTLNLSSFDNYIFGDFVAHYYNGLYTVIYTTTDTEEVCETRAIDIKGYVLRCLSTLIFN